MELSVPWEQLKTFMSNLPYCKYDMDSDHYCVYCQNGFLIFYSVISGDDKTDYDNNYLGGEMNFEKFDSVTNAQIFSPTLDDVMGLYPKKQMYKNNVVAGQVNIFDVEVENEKRICGGEYWVDDSSNIHADDKVDFSIVDKNDVLGLFTALGLEVGTDVLEIVKFVKDGYIKKGDPAAGYHSELYQGIKGTNRVVPGLFYRATVDSNGTVDFDFLWRMYFYE